jgi:multicomponent Na+:H+ antiporter subunit G
VSLGLVIDVLTVALLLLGAFLSLAAGVGLLRFPDAITRMHATTKPQILGLLAILAGIALQSRSWPTLLAVVPVLVFQMLTAPISAHMVGRAGYRTGALRRDRLLVDELEDAIARAQREQSAAEPDDDDPGPHVRKS